MISITALEDLIAHLQRNWMPCAPNPSAPHRRTARRCTMPSRGAAEDFPGREGIEDRRSRAGLHPAQLFSPAFSLQAAVVTFYRGGWCPYCNLQLRALTSRVLDEITALWCQLIAISPQLPDGSLSTAEMNQAQLRRAERCRATTSRAPSVSSIRCPNEPRRPTSNNKALPGINGDDSWQLAPSP